MQERRKSRNALTPNGPDLDRSADIQQVDQGDHSRIGEVHVRDRLVRLEQQRSLRECHRFEMRQYVREILRWECSEKTITRRWAERVDFAHSTRGIGRRRMTFARV